MLLYISVILSFIVISILVFNIVSFNKKNIIFFILTIFFMAIIINYYYNWIWDFVIKDFLEKISWINSQKISNITKWEEGISWFWDVVNIIKYYGIVSILEDGIKLILGLLMWLLFFIIKWYKKIATSLLVWILLSTLAFWFIENIYYFYPVYIDILNWEESIKKLINIFLSRHICSVLVHLLLFLSIYIIYILCDYKRIKSSILLWLLFSIIFHTIFNISLTFWFNQIFIIFLTIHLAIVFLFPKYKIKNTSN